MQIVLVSNKSQASTSELAAIVHQSTAFETLLSELNPQKGSGPPICCKLGVLVNSLLKERLSKDQLGMKKEYLFKLEPGRMLLQTSQRETEVNTIISYLYGLTGGQVHNFASKWMELTSDPQILEIIQSRHIEFGEIPTQKRWSAVTNLKASYSDQGKAIIDDLIAEYLSKGIVCYCEPQVDQILSPIFLRTQSDGTYRI